MTKLFTEALKVKTLIGVAILSLIMLFLFKDSIQAVALAGDNEALSLLLGFLVFMVIGVLGIAAFYAISAQEIGKGSVTVQGSKRVKSDLRGGGSVEVGNSEDVETKIDNSGLSATTDPEKKT